MFVQNKITQEVNKEFVEKKVKVFMKKNNKKGIS